MSNTRFLGTSIELEVAPRITERSGLLSGHSPSQASHANSASRATLWLRLLGRRGWGLLLIASRLEVLHADVRVVLVHVRDELGRVDTWRAQIGRQREHVLFVVVVKVEHFFYLFFLLIHKLLISLLLV